MPKRYKLILSDCHLGAGVRLPDGTMNYLENFFFDDEFAALLAYYSAEEWVQAPFDLFLNGDFFEHLQVNPYEASPELMTEAVAVWRQEKIIAGHPKVFAALQRFNQLPDHRVHFNLGNHDAGLLWPEVQELLKKTVGGDVQIHLEPYESEGIRIEHGHRYQADSSFDESKYFLEKGLETPIVNLPWGCYFVIYIVNKIRKERPYFARVYPMRYFIRWALINETLFALKNIFLILYYFISLRFVHSKHRHSSFWQTLRLLKEAAFESSLDKAAKKILLTDPRLKILVMGHSHACRNRYYGPNKLYLNAGTWTERLSLDPANLGRNVRLSYVLISIDGTGNETGQPQGELKEWRGYHEPIRDLHVA